MHNKIQTFLLFILIITTSVVLGISNKTRTYKTVHKKHSSLKEKPNNERVKRSLNDDDDRPFWPNRGKKQIGDDPNYYGTQYNNDLENTQKNVKLNDMILKEQPFWGNRGRRDSTENVYGYPVEYPDYFVKNCEHCGYTQSIGEYKNMKDRRDDFVSPFWGNRGRRNSLEVEEADDDPFWGNRGRRQEKDEPFWGNRGRREEEPFWGNRGRRDDKEPFWGNRGRREEEPFWGNRGRRELDDPFWGNRGRREEEPFWGNRGRRKVLDPNWVRNRKEDLKESILDAISDVENDIENLSRLKKSKLDQNSFWTSRGRENKMSHLFNSVSRSRIKSKVVRSIGQTSEPGTVLDNRMFVDEPKYILVERSSRSSAETEDPYYISRGKKYYLNSLEQAARDRRGAIEEIVKSVRNDPYYIARGKKDVETKNRTSIRKEEYAKAKELICAAIDLTMMKNDGNKVKRNIDNDRDRRTILKKLAAQLQMDPYFVSRGKKNQISGDKDYLQEFVSNLAEKCN